MKILPDKKRNYAPLLISVAVIFTLVIFLFLFLGRAKTCNDGTWENECSKTKPYFCSNGILTEWSDVCGCSNLSEARGNKCISEFHNNPKIITLNYILRGEEGEINFTVYEEVYRYLSDLPRHISLNDGREASLLDFKLKSIDDEIQAEFLIPLVIEIKNKARNKDDQARIAISIIQNIPFGNSNKTSNFGNIAIEYYRYPYEVLYDFEGVCGEKSELLAFLLREIGFGSAFFYYNPENHEALGIKCPSGKSTDKSGYCFVETTGPSIISDSGTEYFEFGQLTSVPEIIPVNFEEEKVFGRYNFYEYPDAKILSKIRENARDNGRINYLQHFQFQSLVKKYGLEVFEGYEF